MMITSAPAMTVACMCRWSSVNGRGGKARHKAEPRPIGKARRQLHRHGGNDEGKHLHNGQKPQRQKAAQPPLTRQIGAERLLVPGGKRAPQAGQQQAEAAIKKYPDEEASVVLIQHYFNHPDDTRQMDELLAVLNPKLNDFYLVRKLQEYSTRAKRTALGAEAPGFNVKNIYGTPVSLDSFPKKYLLLAFTAPWCDMCQTEDLYLDEVAMKYPKEKVDMLLVSLDDDQAEVRKVLAKDSIGWNLVTDSAGQAAMLVDLYNVSALPRCFLIDEEGKIILKTDNGVEIKQTLEKLME